MAQESLRNVIQAPKILALDLGGRRAALETYLIGKLRQDQPPIFCPFSLHLDMARVVFAPLKQLDRWHSVSQITICAILYQT